MDVTIWGALFAGLLSFVSPCVLPLVPPYLCYLAGVTLEDLSGDAEPKPGSRLRVLATAIAFVLGFSTIFISLGAAASAFGQQLRRLQGLTFELLGTEFGVVQVIVGLVIVTMGLHFLGIVRIPFLNREARFRSGDPAGLIGAYLFGVVFAFGWSPCIGPVLGTIMAVAGTRDTLGEGAFLLAVYSAGMGVPFIAAALFAAPFLRLMRRFRRHLGTVERAMGAFLVLIGILFISGQITLLATWLANRLPFLVSLT